MLTTYVCSHCYEMFKTVRLDVCEFRLNAWEVLARGVADKDSHTPVIRILRSLLSIINRRLMAAVLISGREFPNSCTNDLSGWLRTTLAHRSVARP
jgi:hypothetical protein